MKNNNGNLNLSNTAEKELIKEIIKIFEKSETFFIAGHSMPDGDALGSGFALASVLARAGKKVTHCTIDPVPEDMVFMPGSETIKHTKSVDGHFDCAVILECINFERMGNIISPQQADFVINIDHHLAHTNYGNINYVVPSSSSVSELVYNIFIEMGVTLTKAEAENLYIGIVTDTGRFQQLNTTSNSHLVAAHLLDYGVNSNELCKKLFLTTKIEKLRLYGLALSNIQTALNDKFVYIKLYKDMFEKTHAAESDTDGIINFCISVPTAVIGCVAREVGENKTKISLRSVSNFNLLDIVARFDGGGHKNAAGCTINSNVEEAVKQIMKVAEECLSAGK